MSSAAENAVAAAIAPVNAVVAMIRVRDVERSAEFYRRLGFEIGNYVPRECPPMQWAWLYQPNAPNWKTGANLMLVRGSAEGWDSDPDTHVVLYLYAADLVKLRHELIAAGVKADEISYPEYLPKGEFRTHDPDGYTVMLAQSYEQSP
jgi:catechol 2,3-dioxygenase-like lactoylglutathione lyase family enzyme